MRQLLTLALALTLFTPLSSSAQSLSCIVNYRPDGVHYNDYVDFRAVDNCAIPKADLSNVNISYIGFYTCNDKGSHTDYTSSLITDSYGPVVRVDLKCPVNENVGGPFVLTVKFGVPSGGTGGGTTDSGYYCNRVNPAQPTCEYRTTGTGNVPLAQCMTSCLAPESHQVNIVTDLNSLPVTTLPWTDENGYPIFEIGQEIGFWAKNNFPNVKRYSWNFDDKMKGVSTIDQYPDNVIYNNVGLKKVKLDLLDTYNNLLAATTSVVNIIPKLWVKTYANNKLINLQENATLPINTTVTFAVNSNVTQVFPSAKQIWTSWTIKKIGSDQQNFTQERTNLYFTQPFKFIFKSPGKYEITALVKGLYPPQVGEIRPMFIIPEQAYVNISCTDSVWDNLKVKKTISSLLKGEVVDINADNLEQWIRRDNPKIIKSMMELQQTCAAVGVNKVAGKDIFQQFKNDPPNKKPVHVAIYNNESGGHAMIAIDFKKDISNSSEAYKIGVVDPNLPQQINYLENCQYRTGLGSTYDFQSQWLDNLGGAVICKYPYKPWSNGTSEVAVIIDHTEVSSGLLKSVYSYCVANDFLPSVCNRYGTFGYWLKGSLPLSLTNFTVQLSGSEYGNCAGWAELVLRTTYLGNFVGGGSCSVVRDSNLQVGAVGLSDIWTYFIKLGEWFKLPTSN